MIFLVITRRVPISRLGDTQWNARRGRLTRVIQILPSGLAFRSSLAVSRSSGMKWSETHYIRNSPVNVQLHREIGDSIRRSSSPPHFSTLPVWKVNPTVRPSFIYRLPRNRPIRAVPIREKCAYNVLDRVLPWIEIIGVRMIRWSHDARLPLQEQWLRIMRNRVSSVRALAHRYPIVITLCVPGLHLKIHLAQNAR